MTEGTANYFMVGLDVIMIIYTLWVLSLGKPGRVLSGIGFGLFAWLGMLHLGLSSHSLFSPDISGIAFLGIIVAVVGAVGVLLFMVTPVRQLLLGLSQQQLLLLQGIRVFFGANFLMQASQGILPASFGIIDGWTHIAAGFFGLLAAFALAGNEQGIRRAWFANLFGLADILVVASTLALLLLPSISPYHGMMYAVFLPAPLWLWFHLVSIWKLVNAEKPLLNEVLA